MLVAYIKAKAVKKTIKKFTKIKALGKANYSYFLHALK
jgi:hypothetical protein